jgi:hypothetical protein
MDPVKVLRLAAAMGDPVRRVLLVGCEPGIFGTDEDPVMGLSAPVEASVAGAIELIDSLIVELLASPGAVTGSSRAHVPPYEGGIEGGSCRSAPTTATASTPPAPPSQGGEDG